MMPDNFTHFEQRLERIERQNRMLRLTSAVLFIASAGTLAVSLTAQPRSPQMTSAQSFVVVDGEEKTRATLGMRGLEPVLSVVDVAGKERVRLTLKDDGPTLTWVDKNGQRHEVFSEPGIRRLTER
jgi:hypothetical protein